MRILFKIDSSTEEGLFIELLLSCGAFKIFFIFSSSFSLICVLDPGSGKEIQLQDLNYWNVELQEAYFSPIEANKRFITQKK